MIWIGDLPMLHYCQTFYRRRKQTFLTLFFLVVSSGLLGCTNMRGLGTSLFGESSSLERDEFVGEGDLESIHEPLPKLTLAITPEVRREIVRYTTRERGTVEEVLSQRGESFESIQRLLKKKGVPEELVSLAAVESNLNQYARSPAGATGLWQFMRRTAQSYGLEVSRTRDERLDFTRSTLAAAQHLRDLFRAYGDWGLALAAYNAGRTKINRKLRKTKATDFWQLAHAGELSNETRRFVPRVIAMTLILDNPSRYGF